MDTPNQTTPAPFTVAEHEKFEGTDAATPILREENARLRQQAAEKEMREMPGFIEVHHCPRCRTRLKPRTVDGRPSYGKCPHCGNESVPDSKSMYVGKHAALTNPYRAPSVTGFATGVRTNQDLGIVVKKVGNMRRVVGRE